jgi:hypothetical protein
LMASVTLHAERYAASQTEEDMGSARFPLPIQIDVMCAMARTTEPAHRERYERE